MTDTPSAARVTHGRHCSCSACAREDWTRITGPCGMHGKNCPAVYAPISPAARATGVLVWREREDEPHAFDLVDAGSGEIFEGDEMDDTIMFGPPGSVPNA